MNTRSRTRALRQTRSNTRGMIEPAQSTPEQPVTPPPNPPSPPPTSPPRSYRPPTDPNVINLVTPIRDSVNLAFDDDELQIVSQNVRGARGSANLCTPGTADSSLGEGDVACVGAKKGVTVLADYPHMRFQCSVVPWDISNSRTMLLTCDNCFCYPCDEPASKCGMWIYHCFATDKDKHQIWKGVRQSNIKRRRAMEKNLRRKRGPPIVADPSAPLPLVQQPRRAPLTARAEYCVRPDTNRFGPTRATDRVNVYLMR